MWMIVGGLCVLVWGLAIAFGMQRIWAYAGTPGSSSVAPGDWRGSHLVNPRSGRYTLIMFIHPHCTCTQASLAELQEVSNRFADTLSVWVLVHQPPGAGADWESTPNVERARKMRNVKVAIDVGGTEAKRFGAETSGHVLLYGVDGALQFSGGITGARGHVGDNEGLRSVIAIIGGASAPHTHPIFGCGFHDRDRAAS